MHQGCYADSASALRTQEWIPDSVWLNVVALGSMDAFRDVADAVARGDAGWRSWYDTEAPERAPVPAYEEQLSKFERMCIVKACPLLKCCVHPRQPNNELPAFEYLASPAAQTHKRAMLKEERRHAHAAHCRQFPR